MTRHSQPSTPVFGQLPFAGLGLDLAPMIHRASLLVWRKRRDQGPVRLMPRPFIPVRAHGFALLTWLGRETRGR